MNNPDRAPGVHLVTDRPGQYVEPPVSPDIITVPDAPLVNLKERNHSGLYVSLDWDGKDVSLFVRLGTEAGRRVIVPADNALDAFEHPYCYVGGQG